jgi:hypothetical protein
LYPIFRRTDCPFVQNGVRTFTVAYESQMSVDITVFWDVTPECYRRFGETVCLHLKVTISTVVCKSDITVKITVLCDVTPCILVEWCRRFERTCGLMNSNAIRGMDAYHFCRVFFFWSARPSISIYTYYPKDDPQIQKLTVN